MTSLSRITCIGELIVDFISTKRGKNISDAPSFSKHAGGAAANVAVGLARLGVPSSFVGRVGDDPFGRFLHREVRSHGVDVSAIRFDRSHKTRIAFVSRTKAGDRDFEFWERQPADEQLRPSDLPFNRISHSAIVHLSSFLLLQEPSRSTVLALARKLRKKGREISFDPNLRPSLWQSPNEARRVLLQMAAQATLLRLNEEEAAFLTGKRHLRDAMEKLILIGPSVVVATCGARGCSVLTADTYAFVKGCKVHAVDTTGCGDAFLAGLLRGIVKKRTPLRQLTIAHLREICRYANAVGALASTRTGGIASLPHAADVHKFLSKMVK
jgi:fructokinase